MDSAGYVGSDIDSDGSFPVPLPRLDGAGDKLVFEVSDGSDMATWDVLREGLWGFTGRLLGLGSMPLGGWAVGREKLADVEMACGGDGKTCFVDDAFAIEVEDTLELL
jgi:hypothetical protein